jgi:hypothetical protein
LGEVSAKWLEEMEHACNAVVSGYMELMQHMDTLQNLQCTSVEAKVTGIAALALIQNMKSTVESIV